MRNFSHSLSFVNSTCFGGVSLFATSSSLSSQASLFWGEDIFPELPEALSSVLFSGRRLSSSFFSLSFFFFFFFSAFTFRLFLRSSISLCRSLKNHFHFNLLLPQSILSSFLCRMFQNHCLLRSPYQTLNTVETSRCWIDMPDSYTYMDTVHA